MIANSKAYRSLVTGPIFILADGVTLEARRDDAKSYLVVFGDGKKIDGYLAIILTMADGFPLIGDIIEVKGESIFKPENEIKKRRLKKFEKLVMLFEEEIASKEDVDKAVKLGLNWPKDSYAFMRKFLKMLGDK
ncbi:MAG: hypothetical protein ACP6IP_09695 [Candidatus Njordarchaeia archaeon]